MKRREFISFLGSSCAWPRALHAQQASGRMYRVGVLFAGSGVGSVPDEAFRRGLRARGYVEGQNLSVEFRTAAFKYDQLPNLATELVAMKVDVIFAPAEPAIRATLEATRSLPIIMAAIDYDPIEAGLVTNIGRPTGNVTGVYFNQQETSGKRVQLLKEALPSLSRIAALIDPRSNPAGKFQLDETGRAARALGMNFRILELSTPPDLDKAFDIALTERIEGLVVLVSPTTYAQRAKIAGLAKQHRIPAIAPFSEFAEVGGLMSYGASIAGMFIYAASYVDRILKGATPADLPVEQPKSFDLSINLETAKALGLTMPHSLLLRADNIIE